MISRSLTRPQNPPQEIDFHGLQMFQDDTVRELREMQEKLSRQQVAYATLAENFNRLDTMLTWIHTHRAEAILDFQTTMDVTNRLSDSNNGEVMTESMV